MEPAMINALVISLLLLVLIVWMYWAEQNNHKDR